MSVSIATMLLGMQNCQKWAMSDLRFLPKDPMEMTHRVNERAIKKRWCGRTSFDQYNSFHSPREVAEKDRSKRYLRSDFINAGRLNAVVWPAP